VQRILSILILLVYVSLAVGVNVLHHTCGGTTDANFAPVSQEDPCGCADVMDPADRCCTVEIKSFQVHDEQVALALVSQPTLDAAHIVYPLVDDAASVAAVSESRIPVDTSPPRAVSATILNCSFLI
jgi:hypothetical protein